MRHCSEDALNNIDGLSEGCFGPNIALKKKEEKRMEKYLPVH